MKRKPFVIAIAIFGAGLVLLYYWFAHPEYPVRSAWEKLEPIRPNPKGTDSHVSRDAGVNAKSLVEESGKLNVPIDFYGRVVDQDGSGIAGATVYYSILGIHFIPGANFDSDFKKTGKITTREGGAFFIGGVTATSLSIFKIDKVGYRQPKHLRGEFGYAGTPDPHHPDSKEPVRFTMFREDEIVDLIHYDRRIKFAWDGLPKRFDIMTGRPSPTGIVEIIPKRARFSEGNIYDFDWSMQISIVGGGIIYSPNQNGSVAPEGGYSSSVTFGNGDHDLRLHNSNDVTLYARLPAGNFARLELTIYPSHRDTSFGAVLQGFINPKIGSRVLEYVPSLNLFKQ